MLEKVQQLLAKLQQIEGLLGLPEVLQDQKRYRQLTQEHAQLSTLKEVVERSRTIEKQLTDNKKILEEEKDPEMISLLREEIAFLETELPLAQKQIESLIVPPDPRDSRNIIMELRAGTGGDEAALFVGDCIRMYRNYATSKGWKCETLSSAASEFGGYKEYVMSITGQNVFRLLQYEAGTHRVQRVPATETQGRVHTSAITVAILL